MRIVSEAAASGATIGAASRGGILIVENDEGMASTLSAILRHDGYDVRASTAYNEVLALVRETAPDVLLIDLHADESGSDNLLADIRAQAPELVVIVLARYASFDAALRALRVGAYDYLVKPVDVDELRARVARGIEHRRLRQELAARVSELEQAHAQARDFNVQLQRQVEQATRALSEQVAALAKANQQLEQAQEDHERFVAMVAHEMRGPLNPIINYAQLAKRPTITPQALDRYTDIIIEHAFRLNRLVDDLQTATRLRTGQFILRREPCDVAAAIAEVVDQFTASVRERRFSLKRPEGPVTAVVDRDRVVQAVRNLLDNAVKYSAEDGAVEVSVWCDKTTVSIRVRDYGAGIPEAEMLRIFDAFTRLEKRTEVTGSGLGLFITRGIVAAHNGTLSVSNESGSERARGAIFTITLPLES